MQCRLSEFEQKTIVNCCKNLDPACEVYLYGSRTDLKAKGGDIDLLVLSEKLRFRDKLDLLSQIKERIGDQKIDLSILTQDSYTNDLFFQQIFKIKLS